MDQLLSSIIYMLKTCGKNDINSVRQALARGVCLNTSYLYGNTSLRVSVECNHSELVSPIWENQPDVNIQDKSGYAPSHESGGYGYTEIVSLLLADKEHVNIQNTSGHTPLHISCGCGYTEIVSVLLAHAADVNIQNKSGSTPLHVAAERGHGQIVSLLIENMADVNIQNKSGSTPLHVAAERGHTETASLLLANMADVNKLDKLGRTPLHLSARFDHTEIADLLLAYNADVNAVSCDGFTPLYYADYAGHRKTKNYLLQHGAVLEKLSLKTRFGCWWWRVRRVMKSTTTRVNVCLSSDSQIYKASSTSAKILDTQTVEVEDLITASNTPTVEVEDLITASNRKAETINSPRLVCQNVAKTSISETISTLENGRALALALAGHLEPAVTECLKEFPGTNSEYQPQISTEVSTTVKNGIMNIHISSTVNVNNEILIQNTREVNCHDATINRGKFVGVNAPIIIQGSSRATFDYGDDNDDDYNGTSESDVEK